MPAVPSKRVHRGQSRINWLDKQVSAYPALTTINHKSAGMSRAPASAGVHFNLDVAADLCYLGILPSYMMDNSP